MKSISLIPEKKMEQEYDIYRLVFDMMANTPAAWIKKALALLYSSKLLENNIRRLKKRDSSEFLSRAIKNAEYRFPISWHAIDTKIMINGMALECLFKAMILLNGQKIFENGNMNKRFEIHDLVKLAHEAKIRFTSSEKKLLNLIYKYVIAFGRYPVAKDYKASDYQTCNFQNAVYIDILKKISESFRNLNFQDNPELKDVISCFIRFFDFYRNWAVDH